MRVFFKGQIEPDLEITDESTIRHLHVRRIQAGEHIELMDGNGHIHHCHITAIHRKSAHIKCMSSQHCNKGATKTLLIAVCRFKTLEIIAQKACELGIHTIQPVITDNIGNLPSLDVWHKKVARIQEIMQQSICQCGNPYLPDISTLKKLDEIDPTSYTLADAKGNTCATIKGSILIGPEGGFSDREYNFFDKNNVARLRFGGFVLRAETAAIIAMSKLSSAL